MPSPKAAFFLVFGMSILIGLGIGSLNLASPDTVALTLDGKNIEGMGGIWLSLFASTLPGAILGVVAMGVRSRFVRQALVEQKAE